MKQIYTIFVDYNQEKILIELDPEEIEAPRFRTNEERQKLINFHEQMKKTNLKLRDILEREANYIGYSFDHPFNYAKDTKETLNFFLNPS